MALQDNLSGAQRDAFEAVNNLFSSYGLGSLAPKIYSYIQNGYSADTVSILLQQSPEYQQRFAGNQIRQSKGLPVLSPSQYLANESQYRSIMQESGMPAGFYDQPSDFNQFIGDDISPSELQSRVKLASDASTMANPNYMRALQQMYGIDQKSVAAYFLDESRAVPLLQKQAAAAAIGGEALKRGLQVSPYSEAYATAGVTQAKAAQVYGQIAQQLPEYQSFSSLYGEHVTQTDFERALLEDNTTGNQAESGFMPQSPEAKLEQLASWNRARGEGKAGGAQQAFGLASTQA